MTGNESEPQRDMTEAEWIQAFLDKCEPLSQRQLDILTYEFQKAADNIARAKREVVSLED
ncbi:MAG: hypothetical protein EOO27_30580 [Comamonadaceae bacterium]|nr:MAG: hypothetical protein EOO27_30580 [Comamonadaceae bacterium]